MEYETIELEIGLGSGREYPVSVIHSPAGEAQAVMRFPFDELALENRLLNLQNALLRSGGKRRQFLSPEQETVQRFGEDLFNAIMINGVRSCYERSEDKAQREGKGLRLQLRVRSPEMATLPWEFMYDARRATYLALSPRTPIMRYLPLPQTIDSLLVNPPLRILGMIVNPQGVQPLDVDREKQRLERAVAPLQQSGLVDLTWIQGETWRDLQRTIRNEHWHVFHFIGHGGFDPMADEGLIVMADEQKQPQLLLATQLAELLSGYYPPRLVLLNACDGAQSSKRDIFSSTASILVRHGIPAVVAMQYEITDRAAIEFSHSFYEAIAAGLSIEAAISEARRAIRVSINNTLEWGTPVLYTHAPDGILFRIQKGNIDERKTLETGETGKTKQTQPEILAAVEPEKMQRSQDVATLAQALQPLSAQAFSLTLSALPLIRTVTEQDKLSFWLQWVLANAVGRAVLGAVSGTVVEVVAGSLALIGAVLGTMVGAAQWLILRRYLTKAHWWILATTLSGVLGGVLGGVMLGVMYGAVYGAVVGAAQWLILRRYLTKAHWWILATTVGWVVYGVIGGAVYEVVYGTVGDVMGGIVMGIVMGSVYGAVYGAITGIPLFWLLQHPISNQTAERDILNNK